MRLLLIGAFVTAAAGANLPLSYATYFGGDRSTSSCRTFPVRPAPVYVVIDHYGSPLGAVTSVH